MAAHKIPKTALITGGAYRIGRQICLGLAKKGYKIALHYGHSKARAEAAAKEISRHGGVCKLFPCDLQDEQDTLKLMARVKKTFPDLNLLINNASIYEPSEFEGNFALSFARHININLRAPYLLTGEFSRRCHAGQIINILDARITKNDAHHLAYSLSKKSLAFLTELSAVALAPRIRVNAIAPGIILPPPGKGNAYIEKLAKQIPLQRKGAIRNILGAVQLLLENDDLTGQILYVDGGRHLV